MCISYPKCADFLVDFLLGIANFIANHVHCIQLVKPCFANNAFFCLYFFFCCGFHQLPNMKSTALLHSCKYIFRERKTAFQWKTMIRLTIIYSVLSRSSCKCTAAMVQSECDCNIHLLYSVLLRCNYTKWVFWLYTFGVH